MNYSERYARNLGFFSEQEQDILQSSSVAIAGAGGDGGMIAVQLARLGVGELRLADPDPFEVENINRQAVCTDETIGVNKAEAVGEYISKINPEAKVKVWNEGITFANSKEFVQGADLLIDETEFTLHALAVTLAREARQANIPNLTALNVGFGAIVTTFHPQKATVESRLGLRDDQPIEEVAGEDVPLSRWLPYLPNYVDLKVFEKVARQEKPAPTVAPGVAIAGGTAATQAALNLLAGQNKRPEPVYAPKALVIDAMTGTAKTIRYNKASHYKHLGLLVARNFLKLNPEASY